MTFDEIKTEIKTCGNQEIRVERPEYLEMVITKAHEPALAPKLSGIFGAPAWPSKEKIPADVSALIQNCGGIMQGQSLYVLREGAGIVFLMLWPWSDGSHTTVKLGISA